MAQQSRPYLKTKFETQDIPTETDFSDLIDSYWSKTDDTIPISGIQGLDALLAAKLNLTGGTLTGQLTLPQALLDTQAPTLGQVRALLETSTPDLSSKVSKTGDVMSGQLTIPDGTASGHAVNKGQMEASIAALVDSSPGTLNTLRELADALGDDENFATTVTNNLAQKANLAGGATSLLAQAYSGFHTFALATLLAFTQPLGTNNKTVATTEFVAATVAGISGGGSASGKADLAGPSGTTYQVFTGNQQFTGSLLVPTMPDGTNTNDAASTQYVTTALAGKADLLLGKILTSQLPDAAFQVLNYPLQSGFPTTGAASKIYIITSGTDANKMYRWDTTTSAYVQIGGGGTSTAPANMATTTGNYTAGNPGTRTYDFTGVYDFTNSTVKMYIHGPAMSPTGGSPGSTPSGMDPLNEVVNVGWVTNFVGNQLSGKANRVGGEDAGDAQIFGGYHDFRGGGTQGLADGVIYVPTLGINSNDDNAASTEFVQSVLGTKAALIGGSLAASPQNFTGFHSFTGGTLTVQTKAVGTDTTEAASTAFVKAAINAIQGVDVSTKANLNGGTESTQQHFTGVHDWTGADMHIKTKDNVDESDAPANTLFVHNVVDAKFAFAISRTGGTSITGTHDYSAADNHLYVPLRASNTNTADAVAWSDLQGIITHLQGGGSVDNTKISKTGDTGMSGDYDFTDATSITRGVLLQTNNSNELTTTAWVTEKMNTRNNEVNDFLAAKMSRYGDAIGVGPLTPGTIYAYTFGINTTLDIPNIDSTETGTRAANAGFVVGQINTLSNTLGARIDAKMDAVTVNTLLGNKAFTSAVILNTGNMTGTPATRSYDIKGLFDFTALFDDGEQQTRMFIRDPTGIAIPGLFTSWEVANVGWVNGRIAAEIEEATLISGGDYITKTGNYDAVNDVQFYDLTGVYDFTDTTARIFVNNPQGTAVGSLVSNKEVVNVGYFNTRLTNSSVAMKVPTPEGGDISDLVPNTRFVNNALASVVNQVSLNASAISGKANKAGGADFANAQDFTGFHKFTGAIYAPDQSADNNSQLVANTKYVDAVKALISGKASLAGGATDAEMQTFTGWHEFTGDILVPNQTVGNNSFAAANTRYVDATRSAVVDAVNNTINAFAVKILAPISVAVNTTVSAGVFYYVTANGVTLTIPSPNTFTDGTRFGFALMNNVNSVTIDFNGTPVNGATDPGPVIFTKGQDATFIYTNAGSGNLGFALG